MYGRSQNICNIVPTLQTNKQIIHKQYFNESLITDAPVPEPVKTIYGLQLERTAYITVTIQSNPRPNTHWSINNNVNVNEGESRERYEAQAPREVVSNNIFMELFMSKLRKLPFSPRNNFFCRAMANGMLPW